MALTDNQKGALTMANAANTATSNIFQQISELDAMGFIHKVNTMGQVVFTEGKDWAEFLSQYSWVDKSALKKALIDMGRIDAPWVKPAKLIETTI